ncbi:MAG TPA: HAMP domain-containing sensor histidine kinase [Tepidisphaeraceae bacterium]
MPKPPAPKSGTAADCDAGVAAVQPGRPHHNSRPWHRTAFMRLGIQGKLIIAFMCVLITALGATCWLFLSQSNARLEDIMGEQARQISAALALASKPSLESNETAELRQIGQDLLKSRNILFVAFLDHEGSPITMSSRDPDFTWDTLPFIKQRTLALMQVYQENSPVFGRYAVVTAPVLNVATPMMSHNAVTPTITPGNPDAGTKLLGYVSVGISQASEEAQIRRINYWGVLVGVGAALLALPFAYALVHRIFLPIRQLVAATRRIAAGDLSTSVAVDRPDQIGELARSFNDMVLTVRRQQDDLNSANESLAQANVKLAHANEGLEQKVTERTAQLEVANTRLSTEIAEKEDFIRAVSHDLNAPLRNIDGMTTMLLMKHKDKFDEDIVHRLERIQKNVQMETDLIAELLELSRIKTRRQKMEVVDLQGLVQDLAGVFENDFKSKRIHFVTDTPLPRITGERARLRQVFQNLIDNAVKYMGDGGITREIHVGCDHRAGEVEFYVRDTGIGIEPEELSKVFVVFRRGKNTQAQNVAGKGVGLASVKSIVETYSGTIWAESQVGAGSTFRFTINGRHVAPEGATAAAVAPLTPSIDTEVPALA